MTIFRTFSADLSTRAATLNRRRAAWPLLILAFALAALAAFLVHDSRPAAAQQEQITVFHHVTTLTPKLQNTGFLGCSNSGGDGETPCSTAIADSTFTYKGTERTIFWALLTPNGSFYLSLPPSQKGSELVGLTARVGVEKTVNGVTTVEIKSFELTSDILIEGTFGWDDTGMTWTENGNVYLAFHDTQDAPEITFGGATISDKTYTAGARVNQVFTSAWDQGLPRLPMATGGGYTHTYTASGLPAGLRIGYDLVIRGTPEAATSEPAEVTYTVTDEVNQTASLTFNVTVKPPVEFNASELADFHGTYLEYTIGQDGGLSATMPSASGGHGALTYALDYYDPAPVSEYKPVDDLSGFSFNAATRALTSDSGSGAPSVAGGYAVRYSVVDTNGSRQEAFSRLAVFAAPTFAAIEGKSLHRGRGGQRDAAQGVGRRQGAGRGPDLRAVAGDRGPRLRPRHTHAVGHAGARGQLRHDVHGHGRQRRQRHGDVHRHRRQRRVGAHGCAGLGGGAAGRGAGRHRDVGRGLGRDGLRGPGDRGRRQLPRNAVQLRARRHRAASTGLLPHAGATALRGQQRLQRHVQGARRRQERRRSGPLVD